MKMNNEEIMNVYFIKAGEYVKIGIAKNIKSRISALQTGQAVKIEFCGAIRNLTKCEARKYEMKLHKFFRNCWASGEWFLLPTFELYDEDSKTIVYGDGGFFIDAILEEDTI
jgi:hypothetical protein